MKKSMMEVAKEIAHDMLECGVISKAQYAAYPIMIIREKKNDKNKKKPKKTKKD